MVSLTMRTKIMACCIGVVVLLDLMVVVFVRRGLSATLREECLVKGRNMAVNLAGRSERFVLTDGFVSLMKLVRDLEKSDQDVVYAYVADRKGRTLAHTFEDGFPADLVGGNTPRPGDKWSLELLDIAEEGLVHDIAVPMLQGKVGVVHVGISERRIQRSLAHFTTGIVAISGIVLVAASGLAAIVSWVVTQPVRNLTKAAQRIRDGELGQQVEVSTQDEIGDLARSFNQMSAELLKQHKLLDDRNQRIRIAREQAAGERDKLRAIIDSMAEGVIFVNADGRIAFCNGSAERIWGVKAGELLGRRLLDCHSLAVHPRIGEILRQAKEMPGFAVTQGMQAHRGGGCRVSNYSSVHGEDGRYLGLVMLTQDISERVALEQEHKRLRDQLFQQEKIVLIGQLAASVAHELNTPLGTILLRTQLLRRQLGEDYDLSDLTTIEGEAQRCRRIIDSLLGFSRRSAGVMAKVDVNSLITESLSLIENDLALKHVLVKTDFAGNGAIVRVDGNQIQQVLLNLFTNAADAMPEGGHLEIGTRLLPCQETVEIRVADDGCGMDQAVLDQAYDPFFTTKERGKGTGLGLAICRRIAEEHDGEIEIQSQPGQGTTVLIRLPHVSVDGAAGD